MYMITETKRRSGVHVLSYTPGFGGTGEGWTPIMCSRDFADLLFWKARFHWLEGLLGMAADGGDTVFRTRFCNGDRADRWHGSPTMLVAHGEAPTTGHECRLSA